MRFSVTLALPRDERSIPVARRLCREVMGVLGVDGGCGADLELALTEACANALRHAREGSAYEVWVCIQDREAVVEIHNVGEPFEAAEHGTAPAPADAERGRGIHLIRSLVDSVSFGRRGTDETVVHLEKHLELAADAPLRRLADAPDRPAAAPSLPQ
jgi:serine/threonine-protein kinase RsbW